MTVKIVAAKRELYNQLKHHEGVIGAGVSGKSGAEYIVIFVTQLTARLSRAIPKVFKGIKVKTEERRLAKAV
jgi:hypothetical protein